MSGILINWIILKIHDSNYFFLLLKGCYYAGRYIGGQGGETFYSTFSLLLLLVRGWNKSVLRKLEHRKESRLGKCHGKLITKLQKYNENN